MISRIFFQRLYVSPKENFYSNIYFNFSLKYWECCSPAALMSEPSLVLRGHSTKEFSCILWYGRKGRADKSMATVEKEVALFL
jgi:hypothetical protein